MNSYKNTLTLNNLLKFIVNVFPDYPVIYKAPHGYEIRSTYREEYEHILRIANALKSLGLGRGDRVATLDWNTIWHFRLYWAVPLMGAVLHPVNVRLSIEDIIYIINKAEDKVIIYHRDFSDIIEKIKNKLHNVRYYIQIPDGLEPKTSDMTIDELEKSGKAEPLPDVDEDLIATINFTSGTTGKPKGAYFTHKQHVIHAMANAIVGSYKGFMRCECQEKLCKFLVLVPMFHVHAWGKPYSFGLQGVGQVYPGRFNTTHIIKLIVEEEIKYMEGVPTILYMLLTDKTIETYREDIKKIRPIFTVGGAALPRELAKKAEEYGFEVRVGYGMTETAPVLLVNYLRPHENIPLSEEERYNFLTATGLPIPLVDLMVVDENLNPVPRDGKSIGEIVVRAPWVTPEYLGDLEKTKEAWRGGWFHTGDVAVWLPDGRVRIVDRAKDVIKSGGEWISSLQLEDLISTHPAVAQVAVIGVPHEKWGERPVAVVVLKPGATATEQDIIKHLEKFVEAGKIPKWWLPDKIIFTNQLPLTGTGKIDKKILKEQYKDALK